MIIDRVAMETDLSFFFFFLHREVKRWLVRLEHTRLLKMKENNNIIYSQKKITIQSDDYSFDFPAIFYDLIIR